MSQTLKKVSIAIGLILLAAALFVAWAIVPGSDREIRERADAIAIPDSWELTYEKVTPPLNLCLEKSGCPSVQRQWEIRQAYSSDELEKIFNKAGVALSMEDDCELTGVDINSRRSICIGSAQQDGYWYNLSHATIGSDLYRASLTVKRLHD